MRKAHRGLLTALLSASIFGFAHPATAAEITMATWGGKFGETFQKNMIEPFEKQSGHKVKMIFGGSLSNKQQVAAQKDKPQIDVLMMADADALDAFRRGLTEALDPKEIPMLNDLTALGKLMIGDKIVGGGLWAYGWGILYRTDKVKFDITSWADLWDPRLKNSVALPSPKYGQSMFLVAVNRIAGGKEPNMDAGFGRIQAMKDNAILEFDGSVAVVKQFTQGEATVVPIISITASIPIGEGVPAKFVVPKEGAPSMIDAISLVKGAPNAKAAKEFLNFAISAPAIGPTCITLKVNCVNNKVPEDKSALISNATLQTLYSVDDVIINDNKGAWLERWAKDVSPILKK